MNEQSYFLFNNKDSRDYHLYIENEISFPAPENDIEFVEVLGRDGELAIDNERLKSMSFSIPVILRPPYDVRIEELSDDITHWLKSEVGWFPLRFGKNSEFEYSAMIHEQFNIQETLFGYGRAVLNFKIKPYKRLINEQVIPVTNNSTLVNNYGRVAKPLIKITGSGDINIRNNGLDWLKLRAVDGNIEIDSELMSAYKGRRPAYDKMRDMNPRFPLLSLGANKISWTGNITNFTISPRWEEIS